MSRGSATSQTSVTINGGPVARRWGGKLGNTETYKYINVNVHIFSGMGILSLALIHDSLASDCALVGCVRVWTVTRS